MIASILTKWLIRQEAIEPDDRELYEYAIQSLYYSVAPILLLLVIGACLGRAGQGLLLGIPICLIRKFSGGYHARYGWLCLMLSIGVLLCCMLLLPKIPCGSGLLIVTLLACVSLGILSPIDSENRPLDDIEKTRYKRAVLVITAGCEMAYLIAWQCGQQRIAVCIAIGIIVSALLQVPCIPRWIREKATKDK